MPINENIYMPTSIYLGTFYIYIGLSIALVNLVEVVGL